MKLFHSSIGDIFRKIFLHFTVAQLTFLFFTTVAFPLSVQAKGSLFSDKITDEEIAQFKRNKKNIEDVSKSLEDMALMMMYIQFQKGECDAAEKIEQEAVNGDAKNQYLLGSLYLDGLCVGKNQKKAIGWIKKAADQENPSAQHDMGMFYFSGNGVEVSKSTAETWFLKCAKKNDVKCQRMLGYMHNVGDGVLKDINKATLWFEKAALQNDEHSIGKLAFIYIDNNNFTEAEKWLYKGAERNQHKNQIFLATILANKTLGRFSLKESYKWANLASLSSNEQVTKQAKELRTNLEVLMTPNQITEAQKLSSEWKPIKDDIAGIPAKKSLPKIAAVGKISEDKAREKLKEYEIPITRLAFFEAVEKDNFEVFELFVKAGADINTERVLPEGVTPLYWAVDFGSKRIIDYLLNNGADINKRNLENGMTPLVRAISHKRWDVVDRLLNMGATAKQQKETLPERMTSLLSGTPLAYSLMFNKPTLVKRLLKNGASVNERYIYNRTPLTEAVRSGYSANVKVLLEAGAKIDAKTQFGNTALLVCFSDEKAINHKIAEILLKAGASTKYRSNRVTPLFRAVMKGDSEAILILKKHGYDINERYRFEQNQIPMNIENKQLLDLLKNGGTPLMISAMQGKYGAAKALVELGADLEATVVTEKVSYTLKDLAKKSGNSMLINYLVKHK